MTIEELLQNEERQTFDRKSVMIESKALAIPLVAFANADGGKIFKGTILKMIRDAVAYLDT